MGGICAGGTSDASNNSNNNNSKDSNRTTDSTSTSNINPLSGLPDAAAASAAAAANGTMNRKRTDSLSSIDDEDDENERVLRHHKPPEVMMAMTLSGFSPVVREEEHASSTAFASSVGSATSSSTSSSSQKDVFSSLRSTRNDDLGRQREDATVDLADDFFVWDDMKYDLRSERARPAATMNLRGRMGGKSFVNTGRTTPTIDGEEGASGVTKPRLNKILFNDFIIDEIDLSDDGVSSFTTSAAGAAAFSTLTSATFISPKRFGVQNSSSSPVSVAAAAAAAAASNSSGASSSSSASPSTPNSNPKSSGGSTLVLSPVSPQPAAASAERNSNSNSSSSGGLTDPNANASAQEDAIHSLQQSLHLRPLGGEPDQVRKVLFSTLGGHPTRVKVLAISPSEKEFVSCSSDDVSVTYADMDSGRELGAYIGHSDAILSCCFSHCGKFLTSTSRDCTMILWDVVTQKALLTFEHSKVVIVSAWSRDSRFILSGSQDKVLRIWAKSGKELGTFSGHSGIVIDAKFSHDGSYCVSASSDHTLRKWAAVPTAAQAAASKETGKPLPKIGKQLGIMQGHEGIILSCNFTGDGVNIISNDERQVRVWKADNCSCIRTFQVEQTIKLRNLPANKKLTWTLASAAPGMFPHHLIVAANNRFIYIFNIETGDEEYAVYCKSPIYCLTAGTRLCALTGDAFGNIYKLTVKSPHADLDPPSTRPPTPAIKGGDFS